jgi:hypothetical protein
MEGDVCGGVASPSLVQYCVKGFWKVTRSNRIGADFDVDTRAEYLTARVLSGAKFGLSPTIPQGNEVSEYTNVVVPFMMNLVT